MRPSDRPPPRETSLCHQAFQWTRHSGFGSKGLTAGPWVLSQQERLAALISLFKIHLRAKIKILRKNSSLHNLISPSSSLPDE